MKDNECSDVICFIILVLFVLFLMGSCNHEHEKQYHEHSHHHRPIEFKEVKSTPYIPPRKVDIPDLVKVTDNISLGVELVEEPRCSFLFGCKNYMGVYGKVTLKDLLK